MKKKKRQQAAAVQKRSAPSSYALEIIRNSLSNSSGGVGADQAPEKRE
jgi:hypothetical protein